MSDTLNVVVRNDVGTRSSRRLRKSGAVPAVLYSQGENVNLSIPTDQVDAAIRHGSKLVALTGAVSESALIREVQWDTFGTEVLHLDLTRVREGQRVTTTLEVYLRGEAPGAKQGGVVKHQTHEIEVECPATSIPEHFEVNINTLALGQVVLAENLKLPEGVNLLTSPETTIVACVEAEDESEEAASMDMAEPEVIGRAAKEEEED